MQTAATYREPLDQWPADPMQQVALADSLDARARVIAREAELAGRYEDLLARRESAADLRRLAMRLRDAAWSQMGA